MATLKEVLSREAIRNPERLVFLSDGVYAIALTILVLDITLPTSFDVFHLSPSQLLAALEGLKYNVIAYIISFIVIGLSWRAHNLTFHYVKRYDTTIFWSHRLSFSCQLDWLSSFLLSLFCPGFCLHLLKRW